MRWFIMQLERSGPSWSLSGGNKDKDLGFIKMFDIWSHGSEWDCSRTVIKDVCDRSILWQSHFIQVSRLLPSILHYSLERLSYIILRIPNAEIQDAFFPTLTWFVLIAAPTCSSLAVETRMRKKNSIRPMVTFAQGPPCSQVERQCQECKVNDVFTVRFLLRRICWLISK